MRISETTNKYLLRRGRNELVIEELKSEKGERIYTVGVLKSAQTAEGDNWSIDVSTYKTIDRKNMDADLKKLLSSL
ncbi:hypothetical protein GWK48_03270 [Metallosphaera tengchongensis]|uniref:Uncharacterized protein n=1 Tax=Metallosphaera tengchongensis TaxID=1532350 RepID=A0A6N0NUI3_9CREN|nr:hypothetical protein [Metallosphaera tengchongensis]QKQ99542.1 hypothetical protein GWK48_03270 [Metallosphaera tengchongensis]